MRYKVWQIYLTDSHSKLPSKIKKATKSVKEKFQDLNYELLDSKSLRAFIETNYSKEVLWAYDMLNPLAYKCDLGRYCLLYKHGGWYFDISIECTKGISIEKDIDMLVFRDILRYSKTSWAVSNGIIWSKPGIEIFKIAIDKVVDNCIHQYYGDNPLYPSGPVVFGEAIARGHRGVKIEFGDLVTPKIPFTRKGIPILKSIFRGKFITSDGTCLGLLKTVQGGDLARLGAHGTNNYNKIWSEKNVYKSNQNEAI